MSAARHFNCAHTHIQNEYVAAFVLLFNYTFLHQFIHSSDVFSGIVTLSFETIFFLPHSFSSSSSSSRLFISDFLYLMRCDRKFGIFNRFNLLHFVPVRYKFILFGQINLIDVTHLLCDFQIMFCIFIQCFKLFAFLL